MDYTIKLSVHVHILHVRIVRYEVECTRYYIILCSLLTHQRPAVVQLWDGEEGFTRLGYEPLGEHPDQRGQVTCLPESLERTFAKIEVV